MIIIESDYLFLNGNLYAEGGNGGGSGDGDGWQDRWRMKKM